MNFSDITALPQGHYGAILADPPWAFKTYSGVDSTPHRCPEDHYGTMDHQALCALPVGDLAAKNSLLFMWVIGSHIDQAIDLGNCWGFTLLTDAFYWFKQKLINAEQIDLFSEDIAPPIMGMGYWTRKQVEPCLLFRKGKPKPQSHSVKQAIIAPRREHSRKPDEQYERIEALCTGPYLELFARTARPGWDCWGNQIGKFEAAA